ncbi:MAG: hypothetical protein C0467_32215 [Planctomycetaceae bacterium]|nr:hypothetical protein [Planctomycetaceae bacterium]
MTTLVTQRFHNLAGTLAELKVKVRTALATELASAVGTAVRDLLVVAMVDRIIATPPRVVNRPGLPKRGGWRIDEDDERDDWGGPKDPWSEDDDTRTEPRPTRYEHGLDREKEEPVAAIPAATAVAVGVHVGRWWLARQGTVSTAVGVGVLATALGFAGGPLARAALAVLAAATDLLTAESALARLDPS